MQSVISGLHSWVSWSVPLDLVTQRAVVCIVRCSVLKQESGAVLENGLMFVWPVREKPPQPTYTKKSRIFLLKSSIS